MDEPLGNLEAVLGRHHALPSPEELADLTAEVEIAGLLQQRADVTRLIPSAWYLHSIASTREALDLYPLFRRRQAFLVSAQLFDLVLRGGHFDQADRARFVFASQIAYSRAEVSPNAVAVYRREIGSLPAYDLFADASTYPLATASALLALDRRSLFSVCGLLWSAAAAFERHTDVHLIDTPYGAAVSVARAIRLLTTFLVYGERAALGDASRILDAALESGPAMGDIDSRWVAAHLREMLPSIDGNSIWSVLPPTVPPATKRAFAMASPAVVTLWPPQIQLVEQGVFAPETVRAVITFPTSAGKTLLAELLTAAHLSTLATDVCFVAPTRSLCRELREALRSRLRYVGAANWVDLADDRLTSSALRGRVAVMTPEHLAQLLREDAGDVLGRYGLFVFDEAHVVGDTTRGWTVEGVISFLHAMTSETDHRIILLSAAVGNAAHFRTWMSRGDVPAAGHATTWRGPRRLHGVFATVADWSTERRVTRSSRTREELRSYDSYGVLTVLTSAGGQERTLRTNRPTGTLVLRPSRPRSTRHPSSTPFYKQLAELVLMMGDAGPTLVICPTRPESSRWASYLSERRGRRAGPPWLIELATARLGASHPLTVSVARGVAYHHASLPDDVLAAIEVATRDGDLDIVVATTTLTEGVNLPVRFVVIAAQGSYGERGYDEFITGSRLLNAIGRAGRATRETEGWVVLGWQAADPAAALRRLQPTLDELTVTSILGSPVALQQLAQFEDDQRAAVDAVLDVDQPHVADFLAFVWFVLESLRVLGEPTREAIDRVLASTLGWVQLDPESRARWRRAATRAEAAYDATGPEIRAKWARSGFSLRSARLLHDLSRAVAGASTPEAVHTTATTIELCLSSDRLETMLSLQEAPTIRIRPARNAHAMRITDAIDVETLVGDWVAGRDLSELARTHFSFVNPLEFRYEQLGDVIAGLMESYLPWTLRVLVEWANEILESRSAAWRISSELADYVRHGVSSREAVELLSAGLAARPLANTIATVYLSERDENETLVDWIATVPLVDFVSRFGAAPAELRRLLDIARMSDSEIVAAFLGGESVTIPLAASTTWRPGICALVDDPESFQITIIVEGTVVGHVPARYFSDVDAIRATGLPTQIETVRAAWGPSLQFQLLAQSP